jgi:NDP-sugar pyrophosphorylase family protein
MAYTGVQVVDEKMLAYIPPQGSSGLVQAWREAMAAGERLAYITVSGHFWQDLGAGAHWGTGGSSPGLSSWGYFPGLTDPLIGPGPRIGAGVRFSGGVCLGSSVAVGEGASLKNTVVWDRAAISPHVELEDCIVASGVQVRDSARGRFW